MDTQSLESLAERLGTSSNHLLEVITYQVNINFIYLTVITFMFIIMSIIFYIKFKNITEICIQIMSVVLYFGTYILILCLLEQSINMFNPKYLVYKEILELLNK